LGASFLTSLFNVKICLLVALQQKSDVLESSFAQEEAQISTTRHKLSIVTIALIVWAIIITLAILIMVALIFTRLRKTQSSDCQRENMSSPESCVSNTSDVEFGSTNIQNTSRKMKDTLKGASLNFEGHCFDSARGSQENSDIETERVEALFEEDGEHESWEETWRKKRNPDLANFNNILENSHSQDVPDSGENAFIGRGRVGGLFLPDVGSSTF